MMKNIVIIAALAFSVSAGAQNATHKPQAPKAKTYVEGVVVDASTHKPLQGAQLSAEPFEAITDSVGHFRIGVSSVHAVITIKRDGYTDRQIAIKGNNTLNVKLFSNAFRSSTSSDAFNVANTAISLNDVLAERMGADIRSVSRSGAAGQGSNLFIRGYNSLNTNAQPLIIVDGTIWDDQYQVNSLFSGNFFNPLADIDVNDIEKVQVLKDASSIYGAKGANGAILITTKRSHSRVTRIDVDLSYGFNLKPKTYDVMGAADYRAYVSELLKGSTEGNALATTFKTYLGLDPTSTDYSTYHNNTDWYDQVYSTGGTQHYGVSVDGSDNVAQYAITVGYTKNDGTVKSTDFSRLNVRINANVKLLPTFNLGTCVYYTEQDKSLQDDGVYASTSPTFIAAIKSPFLVPYSYTDDGTTLTNTLNDVDVLGVSNPVSLLQNAKNTSKHYRFGLSLLPRWDITSNWALKGVFSYTYLNTKEHYFSPMTGVSPVYVDGNEWLNTIKDQNFKQSNIYGQAELSYDKAFGLGRLSAQLGTRIMHASLDNSYAEGHNSGNDNVSNMNNSLSYRSVSGIDTEWNSTAVYLKAAYEYDNRYSLWAVVTEEASSRFGSKADGAFRLAKGSWGTFPSVGAQWNIGNESFMRNLKFLTSANIHASFGITGNDQIDGRNSYSYLQAVNYFSTAVGLKLGSLANDKLKWETTSKFTAGIQASFFDDRLSIGFDYYAHWTKDLLTYKQPDIMTGFESYLCNGGKLKNTGFEVNVGARPIAIRNFSWTTDVAFAHYKNTVTSLPDGNYTTSILGGEVLTAEDSPVGVFYGYKTQGVFASAAEASAANLKVQNSDASYSTFGPGDVHFTDVDGNNIINDNDKQVIGDPNPDLTGSFFNRFTYKRLSLEVMCTYSLGGDIYNYQRQMLESMSELYNQTTSVKNRWKNEGQVTSVPRATLGDPMGNSRFSDRWIEDGSYFKLKNVKLNYQLPISNTYIHGLTIWMAAENLLTWTHYLGADPEVSMSTNVLYQGIDNGYLALGRSFYMGVKINL